MYQLGCFNFQSPHPIAPSSVTSSSPIAKNHDTDTNISKANNIVDPTYLRKSHASPVGNKILQQHPKKSLFPSKNYQKPGQQSNLAKAKTVTQSSKNINTLGLSASIN